MGKSLMVAASALMASITYKYINITIVIPNNYLKLAAKTALLTSLLTTAMYNTLIN